MTHTPVDDRMEEIHAVYTRQGRTDPTAPVRASGAIDIGAPVHTVWSVLADVTNWPHIRGDIHDVEMTGPAAPDGIFTWATGGIKLASKFGSIAPDRLLTWTTSLPGLIMTHIYRFTPKEAGTHLSCDETLDALKIAPQIDDQELAARIKSWLEGIKAVAEARAAEPIIPR